MKARAAVRDVARAMEIPLDEVDRIAKLIPAIPGKPVTIEQCLGKDSKKPELAVPELVEVYRNQEQFRELLDTASALDGVARHASTHAAAVIVTDKPLTEYLPVMRPQKAVITEAVTQFEFPICESIGLLKVDFLGLSTLSVMREAAKLIRDRHGVTFTLDTIPLDDPVSYKLLSSGEVSGVFQVEGAGLRRMLIEMQPREFNHIVAAISLYRPGPMDFIPEYIAVMHGKKEPQYVHPSLEPILDETYGISVYQEQVIRLLTDIAGYTAAEADNVRRGISKKSEKVLVQHREIFAKGAAEKSGIKREDADAIWDALLGFARYGFNRSHAADYAVITVQTAYLKAKYPLEYMAAMLHVERDNSEKVAFYITEARRMGIEVLSPDVNASALDFTVEQLPADAPPPAGRDLRIGFSFPVPAGAAIRYGLVAVKNVGEGPVEAIVAARQQGGPFRSLDDLCERVDLRKVGKKSLECLIKVGALDAFGERGQLLEAIDQMVSRSTKDHEAAEAGQPYLPFDTVDLGETRPTSVQLPKVEPLNPKQRLEMEKELLGVYVSSHPLQQMAVDLTGVITCTCGELDDTFVGKGVVLAGNVVRVNQITTKKGDRMAFVTLEDLQGQCDVTIFPRTWEETKAIWQQDKIVVVRGKAEKRGDKLSVLCESVQDYVVRAVAADDGQAIAPLAAAPVFADGNGLRQPVASFRPSRARDEDAEFGDDLALAAEDQESPFVLEEPEWLREAPVAYGDRSAVIGDRSPMIGDQSAANGEQSSVSGEISVGQSRPSVVNNEPVPDHRSPITDHRPLREIRVTIQRTADVEKDKKLLSWVYDLLHGRPGRDRFCIVVRKNGGAIQLDFPNDTTELTPAVEQQLTRRLGAGSVEVRETAP